MKLNTPAFSDELENGLNQWDAIIQSASIDCGKKADRQYMRSN